MLVKIIVMPDPELEESMPLMELIELMEWSIWERYSNYKTESRKGKRIKVTRDARTCSIQDAKTSTFVGQRNLPVLTFSTSGHILHKVSSVI